MEPPSDPLMFLRSIQTMDAVGLGIIALLMLLGIWRGLWWQVIRLIGIVIAVALARLFSPEVARWTLESWPTIEPRLAHGIAWVSVFLLTMGAASLLGALGQRLIEALQLGLANRLGGAVIGAFTGVLVHLAFLAGFTQLAPEATVVESLEGTYSARLLEEAGARWRVVLGAEAVDELQRVFRRQPAAGRSEAEPAAGSREPDGPQIDDFAGDSTPRVR